jgi:hypothetical protein
MIWDFINIFIIFILFVGTGFIFAGSQSTHVLEMPPKKAINTATRYGVPVVRDKFT